MLGDVALGTRFPESLRHVRRMHGRKVLVPGNHDRCWSGHQRGGAGRNARIKLGAYLEAGFEMIVEAPEPIEVAGRRVLLSHFPYAEGSAEGDRFQPFRPVDDGGWLLHGHVHEKWRQAGRQINVGVDAWAGRPVSLSQIAELIAAGGPANLPPLDWGTTPAARPERRRPPRARA